ncbi:MAG: LPS-assembly protein LptD [Rhodocyclales bacterium GT-UBC]|nr:MAG: LPS-assembly protein LptD [Rhodocyclales bacterium GT-UBC]
MTGFPRRPLAVVFCCLFAGMQTSHAASAVGQLTLPTGSGPHSVEAEEVMLLAANDIPVRLRTERKFNVMARKKTPEVPPIVLDPDAVPAAAPREKDVYPLFITADTLEGRSDEVTEADGHVELRKNGSLLFADHLLHWPLDDEIDATGDVRLQQEGVDIETPHLRMKLSEQIGYAENADFHIVKEVQSKFYRQQQTMVTVASSSANSTSAPMMLNVPNGYGLPTVAPARRPSVATGHAERADFEGENQIKLTNTTYSTCKPGEMEWYLDSASMHLDYDHEVGESKGSTLYFKDVPIFYTPVASFALNHQRRSGFLNPYYTMSTTNGLDIVAPYYWAIAPNYEATFFPRFMAKRGIQLGMETQYIDQYSRGVNRLEYLPNDEIENRRRYAYSFQHQQVLGQGFAAQINWNGVSDDKYWTDMSSRLMQTSQTQLPKQLVLLYSPAPWLQTSLQTLRYQTLQPDPANPITRPYFLEPQLNIIGFKPNVFATDLTLISQYSRFTHPDKVDGERFVFYPQVSVPIVSPAFQITPKFGLHLTKYALGQQAPGEDSSLTRALPTFTLDSTVAFEREMSLQGHDFIQTLEPRLFYVNIPYKDQSKIPVFDAGLSDFNFAQIFSENRYSGMDRINDANQLTAALTTRLLDATTGVEQLKAMVGQRYYFKPQRVTIPGETTRRADFSNLIAAVNGLVAPKTYIDAAWEYNYRDGTNERLSAGVRFQPDFGKVLSASYRYTRDPLTGSSTVDQIDIAGQWPLSARWFAVGRYNWSMRDSQLLEAIGGVEYNDGCWSLRMVAQRLEAVSGSPSTNFYLQLELSDFASIGSNPLGLLRRTIPGYGKTNELPAGSSPFNSF